MAIRGFDAQIKLGKKVRFEVVPLDMPSDHTFSPNERIYKIRDNESGQLGLASFKNLEAAKQMAEEQNKKHKSG